MGAGLALVGGQERAAVAPTPIITRWSFTRSTTARAIRTLFVATDGGIFRMDNARAATLLGAIGEQPLQSRQQRRRVDAA